MTKNIHRSRLAGSFAFMLALAGQTFAADRIEMTLRAVKSEKGLMGNDVCRLLLTVKNGTGNRLENLEFTLSFAGLSKPAKGGTGFPFLSPDSVGSDSEAQFVATWHEGNCRQEHSAKPTLNVDVCAIRGMSERECKALFSLRSELATAAPPSSTSVTAEETANIKALLKRIVELINAKQLPSEKAEPVIDSCLKDFKRDQTEKQAMGCTMVMVVMADWMQKLSKATGKPLPGFAQASAINSRAGEIFDVLKYDAPTRSTKMIEWQRAALELSANIEVQ